MHYDFDIPVLKELFIAIDPATQTADALVFRASHDGQLNVLNSLEKRGYLKRENDSYSVSLVAIDILQDVIPKAKRILTTCEKIFVYLRKTYKKEPRHRITLEEIVAKTRRSQTNVRIGLYYLRNAPIWGGYSTDLLRDKNVSVAPGESILEYKDFGEIIKRIHHWCDAREGSSSFRKDFLSNNEWELSTKIPSNSILDSQKQETVNVCLPPSIARLMSEVEQAMKSKLYALSAMGLRTVIDFVCNDIVGDIGGFDKKLQRLEKDRHISSRNKTILKNTLELCHASAHRAHFPKKKEIDTTYNVVSHLLNEVYILETAAKNLASSAPKRKQKK